MTLRGCILNTVASLVEEFEGSPQEQQADCSCADVDVAQSLYL